MLRAYDIRPIQGPDTASTILGCETVIISPEEKKARVLNGPASSIWRLADGSHSVDDIVHQIIQEYGVDFETAQRDVVEFIEEMAEKNLLIFVSVDSSAE